MEKYAIKKPETTLLRDRFERKLEDLKLLTIEDVAKLFQVSKRTVEGLLYDTRKIPYLKIGRVVRIRERDIVRFLGRTSQGV
tara:strand:+ start:1371 stop:1616 length:246 start_codon:yes stop_codon:yes gene_type:complete